MVSDKQLSLVKSCDVFKHTFINGTGNDIDENGKSICNDGILLVNAVNAANHDSFFIFPHNIPHNDFDLGYLFKNFFCLSNYEFSYLCN